MKKALIFLFSINLISCSSGPSLNEIELRNESVSVKREKAELYYSIAKSLEENSMVEKAIENYQEAIKILPSHFESHYSLGKLLLIRGFKNEGLKKIQYSLALNPKFTEARNFLIKYYLSSPKTYKLAQKLADESVKDLTYANQEETWALKLRTDLKTGGKQLALKSAVKAASIPPTNCLNRLSIASSFYTMDLLGPALNSARSASKLCLDVEDLNRLSFLKGLIFIKKRNLFVAEKILNKIDTQDKKLKNKLTKAQIFVRRKINSGM
jgi:tetratricopeptide (TPR) repeat protein